MLPSHSFKLISGCGSRLLSLDLWLAMSASSRQKVFRRGVKKRRGTGVVNSPLRDYWRTVYKNTCGLQRAIGVPT